LDTNKIVRQTEELVRQILQRTRNAQDTTTKAEHDELTKHLGFNALRFSVVLDPVVDLRLLSVLHWDWQHVYFQGGIFEKEAKAFIDSVSNANEHLGWDAIRRYLEAWAWPRCYASGLEVCAKGTLQGTSSELLSFAPVFARWVSDVVAPVGVCTPQVRSATLLCEVVDALVLAQRRLITPEGLDQRIRTHLHAHQIAYDTNLWIPKCHHSTHLGEQLGRHGILTPCFTPERKHKVIKSFAAPRMNKSRYDMGVLEEVTVQHLYDLRGQQCQDGCLLRPRLASAEMRNAMKRALPSIGDEFKTSRIAIRNGRSISTGDVVVMLCNGCLVAAEVLWFASSGGGSWSCVSVWDTYRRSPKVLTCFPKLSARLVPSMDLIESVICSRPRGGGNTVILLPPYLCEKRSY
jgi:hypothetical protein